MCPNQFLLKLLSQSGIILTRMLSKRLRKFNSSDTLMASLAISLDLRILFYFTFY